MKCARRRLTFSAAVLALALAPASLLFAQDYEIRLHRPDPVGYKCHISTAARETTVQLIKQGDKVIEDKNTQYSVEAELMLTVLAVNEKGRNTRIALDVEKLIRVEGDARKELAPKGSVITASWDGKDLAFEMNGGGLDADTEESLKLLDLLSDNPDGPTDDELFGAKDRKKVGDHWEGNAELMAKDLTRVGLLVSKEDLKATATLEKIVTVGKTECLQLSCVMTCDKFAAPLPAGLTTEKSAMKITFHDKSPVDTSIDLPEESSSDMTMTLTARGKPDPNADEVLVQITKDRTLTGRATAVK